MPSTVTIPRGMRSKPLSMEELQAVAQTIRGKGVGKESVQGPAARGEEQPSMTMEMAMLTPVTPEKAFNDPLSPMRNGPRASTLNAPTASTLNAPRPSTANGPRLPEPVEFMEMPPPAMAPGALAPNGMEDWGSAVYAPGGGMRPIPELQQLPRHVQAELARQNPTLQSFFGGQQAPLQPRGTPQDMATMENYSQGLSALPDRGAYEPSGPLRTTFDGQPFGGFAIQNIPGVPAPPNTFSPDLYDPQKDFTMDFGGSNERIMGSRTPLKTEAQLRSELQNSLANDLEAFDTSSPSARAGFAESAKATQDALKALDGGAGGSGLTFDQRVALKDKDAERSAATRKSIEELERERIAARNKSQEFKEAQAKIMADIAAQRLTMSNYALRLRGIDDGIATDVKLMNETMDPALEARLGQRILMQRNERDALLEALPMIPTTTQNPGGGNAGVSGTSTPNTITVEQLDDIIEQIKAEQPGLSEEEYRRLANQHLDDNGLELADDEE